MVRISAPLRLFRSTGSIFLSGALDLTPIVDYSRLIHMIPLGRVKSQGICRVLEKCGRHLDTLRNPAVALALRVHPGLRPTPVRGPDSGLPGALLSDPYPQDSGGPPDHGRG